MSMPEAIPASLSAVPSSEIQPAPIDLDELTALGCERDGQADAVTAVRGTLEALSLARLELGRARQQVTEISAQIRLLEESPFDEASREARHKRLSLYFLELRLAAARRDQFGLEYRIRNLEWQMMIHRAELSEVPQGNPSPIVFKFNPRGGVGKSSVLVWRGLLDLPQTVSKKVRKLRRLAQRLSEIELRSDSYPELASTAIEYLPRIASGLVVRNPFEEVLEAFKALVARVLAARAKLAARIRQLIMQWVPERTSETGGAAALARRMHPLGAPPHFA
ncbi:hypothetical protein [Burkholderia sp. 3C]